MAVEIAVGYVSLVPETRGFEAKLKKALAGIRDVEIDVDADTKSASRTLERWRASERRDAVNIRVDVDTRSASKSIKKLRTDLGSLGKVGGGVLAIGSLPAMATGVANVAASLQQLAQAGLVVPGILAGIGASASTVAVGMVGVADAFEAVEKASDGTAESLEKANAALAKLAPSAREAVLEASKLKPS